MFSDGSHKSLRLHQRWGDGGGRESNGEREGERCVDCKAEDELRTLAFVFLHYSFTLCFVTFSLSLSSLSLN